ncbi:gamma subclass chorismate mutase AroQ [Lysobacter enzymogenes]|uniref:gamma subclass chorismate mutase AroQ n=1 Tax=Lysobacter enzymogenes TaxID=69 RepID=UPI001AF942EA|nr:gamma subclass chorismate mutase AroQ [Lysobacter enzymogenes]QQQ03423.1 gamma subclass chorismate mutase AroQ [Lysobacter enzymogenes]
MRAQAMMFRCRWLATALAAAALLVALPAAAQSPTPTSSGFERVAELSAQRLLLADAVAASKRASGKPVEDAQREGEQLARVREQATARALPAEPAAAFFRAQMEANKLVQYRLLAEPGRAGAAVDLAPVRAKLDAINAQLLDALPAALSQARGDDCARRASEARKRAARRHRLDELHRTALARAFGDLCRLP